MDVEPEAALTLFTDLILNVLLVLACVRDEIHGKQYMCPVAS